MEIIGCYFHAIPEELVFEVNFLFTIIWMNQSLWQSDARNYFGKM